MSAGRFNTLCCVALLLGGGESTNEIERDGGEDRETRGVWDPIKGYQHIIILSPSSPLILGLQTVSLITLSSLSLCFKNA